MKYIIIVSFGFLSLYMFWPIRNYVNHDRIILARTNGGFSQYNIDYQSFRSWVTCWDNNENYWFDKALENNGTINYPKEIFVDNLEKKYAETLTKKAFYCGSSFVSWKKSKGIIAEDVDYCTNKISFGYDSLKRSYIKNNTLKFLTLVPLMNLYKVVFKNDLNKGSVIKTKSSLMVNAIFLCRTLLILAGIFGCLLMLKIRSSYPLILFCMLLYILFCFIIRYIEMRNLIYADVLMLIPAAYIFRVLLKNIYPL